MAASLNNNVGKTLAEHLLDGKPQWLEDFLSKPYSTPCLLHGKADVGFTINKFCVDCKTPVCPSCILEFGHSSHDILQVYRHVYQDAASVKAIKLFMNIDDIQTYKSNQALVVALRPLVSISKINHTGRLHTTAKLANPNSKNKSRCTKTNTIINKVTSSLNRKNQKERKCQVCGKRLVPMHQFQYCSIQCKLTDYVNKLDRSMPPFLMPNIKTLGEAYPREKVDGNGKVDGPTTTRRRKRKGTPHRAPFF